MIEREKVKRSWIGDVFFQKIEEKKNLIKTKEK